MRKALLIGLKDVKIAFRDRAALIMMLAAPLALTIGLGLVTGSLFSDGDSGGLQDIPLVVVNEDNGELGQALVDVFNSAELETLLEPQMGQDIASARAAVDADETAAVVWIPAGFTDSIIPPALEGPTLTAPPETEVVADEIYANPARPISAGVVEAIVRQFMSQVEAGQVGGRVAVTQLLGHGLIDLAEIPTVARELGEGAAGQSSAPLITLQRVAGDDREEAPGFNFLAFLAAGMAIFFLMYTVTYGGRSLLEERSEGTLARLMSTPTGMADILGGKVIGIFLTGLIQVLLLIGGTALLFRLNWGPPLAVVVLIIATVAGATGWGILLAAIARTPGQVATTGTTLMLLFGIMGGSFLPAEVFPQALRVVRLITPNAWALDALAELSLGATLTDIWLPIVVLLGMAAVLFTIAVIFFRQRGLVRA